MNLPYFPKKATEERKNDDTRKNGERVMIQSTIDYENSKFETAEYQPTLLEQVQNLFGKIQACKSFSEDIDCALFATEIEDSNEENPCSLRRGLELCDVIISETATRLKKIRDNIKFYEDK